MACGDYAARHQKKYKPPVLFKMIIGGMYTWRMAAMAKEYDRSCKKLVAVDVPPA